MSLSKLLFLFLLVTGAVVIAQQSHAQTNSWAEGQIDFAFARPNLYGPGGDPPRLRFLPDGKILAAARFAPGLGSATPITRFLANGQPDPSFNAPVERIDDFQVQPDGKIVYSVRFIGADSYQLCAVKRLNADGSPDTSFNFDFVAAGQINSIAVLPDGRILIGGSITEKVENGFAKYVARLSANGNIDRSFGGNGALNATRIAVQPDGAILALAGTGLQRLTAEGAPDSGFTPFPTSPFISDFVLLPNGKIIVARPNQSVILRLNSNGTEDSAFQSQAGSFRTFAVQSDGKILLAMPTSGRMPFQRLDETGSVIQRFTTYLSTGTIYLNGNDEIYLSGNFAFNGQTPGIFKLHKKYQPTRRKAFDFDGDGKADVAVYRPSDGVWYVLNSATGTFSFTRFGAAGDRPVSADYDGDGRADVAVYRPSTGVWYRLFSSSGNYDAVRFGLAEDIPVQNDFDGDGRDDIAVFRPSDNIWYRLNSSDGSFASFQFGLSGDKPLAGDYDGDGKADYGVYRPSDSNWYRYSSIDGSYRTDNVGYYEGNIGAPADYDGDNRLDLAYFQNSSGSWYGLKSATNGGIYVQWGATNDVPVPADYDGDSKDDIAVWRPADGSWWIVRSSDNSSFAYRFGAPGDIPVQAAYVH